MAGIIWEVFQQFTGVGQELAASAGFVPGLYLVAVGLKLLGYIMRANQSADVSHHIQQMRVALCSAKYAGNRSRQRQLHAIMHDSYAWNSKQPKDGEVTIRLWRAGVDAAPVQSLLLHCEMAGQPAAQGCEE